jgi:hypothetical protein
MLLGLGGLSAVGGAVIGTGALTSVEAERTVDIDVAGDNNAFVGLWDTSSQSYVDTNGSALRIQLDGGVSGATGTGVNSGSAAGKAYTTLDPAFTLGNQGPNTMYVRIDHSGNSGSGNDVQFIADDRASDGSAPEDQTANDVINATQDVAFIDRDTTTAVSTSIHSGGSTTSIPEGGYLTIPSGDKVDVILQVVSDTTSSTTLIDSATIEAFDSTSASSISGWSTVTTP